MQQADKVHRVRNAGVFLLLWPAALTGSHAVCSSTSMRMPCAFAALKAQDAMGVDMRFDTHGAAGAVKRPAFRTSPLGKTDENNRRALEPDKPQGDEVCLNLRPSH